MTKQTISSWIIVCVLSLSVQAFGLPFTQGNLVLYRLGDGVNTDYDLSKSGASPIFLDEYSFDGDGLLELVQSIALPTEVDELTGNKRCVAVPSTTNMGYMTLSLDGKYIAVGGFDGVIGVSPWGAQAASVNRVVALVDGDGFINTTTALNDAFSTKDLRSVYTTNGTDIWLLGNSISGGDGYFKYTKKGNTTSIKISGLTGRSVKGYKNQLYASGQERIYSVGTGFPTAETTTVDITQEPNGGDVAKNPNGYDYCFADLDAENPGTKEVLYFTNSNGTIQKYSLIAGVWTYHGDLSGVNTPRALEVKVVADGVELYVVCEGSASVNGSGKLMKYKDVGGYNNAFVQDGTPVKLLDFTDTKKVIRSITWAPHALAVSINNVLRPDDFSVYSENNMIMVESLVEKSIEVYSLVGAKLISGQVKPGTPTELSGLQKGQLYLVKVGNMVRKVIL